MNTATGNIKIGAKRSYFHNRTGSNIEGNCLRAVRAPKIEIAAIYNYFNKIKLFCNFHTRGIMARGAGF